MGGPGGNVPLDVGPVADHPTGGAVLATVATPRGPIAEHGGPGDLLGAFLGGVAEHVGPAVVPAAVAAVAQTFGFPLILTIAVLLFLVIQSRFDGRDPKLRTAPLTTADTFVPFADGDRA